MLPSCVRGSGKSYPRDGRFKELSKDKDYWYFIDRNNWLIKAPDKWTHYMGSYTLAEVIHQITDDKRWASIVALGLGLLKEYDDGYREGWSRRDLLMDFSGVASAMLLPKNVKLLAYYDNTAVTLRLSLTLP
jgi:hypothetical protein